MGLAASPLLLVGGGKMGEALLRGWIARGLAPGDAHVVEPDAARREGLLAIGARAVGGPDALPAGLSPKALVLAVKPQMMDEVLPAYAGFAEGALVVSIAAGKPIAAFELPTRSRVTASSRPRRRRTRATLPPTPG